MNIEKLKYPIDKLNFPTKIDNTTIKNWINTIKVFPEELFKEVNHLTVKELNYKYRPKGWTIKQVVAHCLDSHINSFIRFKLALTEENPMIRPYKEDKWAELNDTLNYDVSENLQTIKSIHKRLVFSFRKFNRKTI